MKKIIFRFTVSSLLIFSAGCSSTNFFAVSSSANHSGGIYRIGESGCVQEVVFPTLNMLLHDPITNRMYGTSNRIPETQDRKGAVSVFEKRNGKWVTIQTVPVNGKTPCHIAVSPCGTFLYTANYSSGDISEFKIKDNKLIFPPRLIKHTGRSILKRQRSPHPHCAVFDPAGKQLFICDLGTDEVVIYNYIPGTGIQLPAAQKIKLNPGSGPRHLVFDPAGNIFYTANELNSSVSSFVRAPAGSWNVYRSSSTLSGSSSANNAPGAIKITSDGKYFLVTNRGDNTIAVFSADRTGGFHLNYTIRSGGNFPSDLLLFEKQKKAAVCHLKSETLSFFAWDPDSGRLTGKKHIIVPPSFTGLTE